MIVPKWFASSYLIPLAFTVVSGVNLGEEVRRGERARKR